jgi:4'-phosphopantetheinyl transferase EntD
MEAALTEAAPGMAVERWAARHGPALARFRASAVRADLPMTLGEAMGLGKASPGRVHQFATGRALARELLPRLGARSDWPLPVRRDGPPEWPPGLVGSISHSERLCLVGVAPTTTVQALGVDIEPVACLDDAMVDLICRPEEAAAASDKNALAYFVAKEAFYKAYRALADAFLDFQDVRVSFDRSGVFEAWILNPSKPQPAALHAVRGTIGLMEGHHVAICWA